MEQPRSGLLRKMVTGVPSPNTNEAVDRWNRHKSQQPSEQATNDKMVKAAALASRLTVDGHQGSVRERARAYEQKHAAAQVALLQTTQKVIDKRTTKSSNASVAEQARSQPVHRAQDASQHLPASRRSDDKENTTPQVYSGSANEPHKDVPTTSPMRRSVYELPSPAQYRPANPTPSTPRSVKHYSSPPTPSSPYNAPKPGTVLASAFLENRKRVNSSPKPGEWMSPSRKIATGEPARAQNADHILYGSPVLTKPAEVLEKSDRHATQPKDVEYDPFSPDVFDGCTMTFCSSKEQEKTSNSETATTPVQHLYTSQIVSPPKPSRETAREICLPVSTSKPSSPPEPAQIPPTTRLYTRPITDADAKDSQASSPANSLASSTVSDPTTTLPKKRSRSATLSLQSPVQVEKDFEEMIASLNLPATVARKMLALDLNVKSGMLRSSAPTSVFGRSTTSSVPSTSRRSSSSATKQAILSIPNFGESKGHKKRPTMVRKVKSFIFDKESSSVNAENTSELPDGFMLVEPASSTSGSWRNSTSFRKSTDSSGDVDPAVSKAAASQALMLKTATLKTLDPQRDVKKLRVLLRNETLEWLQEWVKYGGYKALMERLHEVMSVEWREEQHDDQVLLELLKCFRGLLMTTTGRQCLAAYSPSPYRALAELLFSEKKPGDLAARQCIVEIFAGLFEVFPTTSEAVQKQQWRKPWSSRDNFGVASDHDTEASSGESTSPFLPMPDIGAFDAPRPRGSEASSNWESAAFSSELSFVADSHKGSKVEGANARNKSAHALVKSLMIGPPNEKEEAKVDFIQRAHQKRVYKLWMDEIIGTLSDYFWIFCHSNNTYWRLENIEEDKVEEPKVPGGMTGGVEYEAMEYCAAHLRLVNQLGRTCANMEEGQKYHSDLFFSGMDKVVLTLRKCSTAYYPQVHLELARYIDLCLSSGYPLHDAVRKHIEPVKALASPVLSQSAPKREPAGPRRHQRSRTEGQILL